MAKPKKIAKKLSEKADTSPKQEAVQEPVVVPEPVVEVPKPNKPPCVCATCKQIPLQKAPSLPDIMKR